MATFLDLPYDVRCLIYANLYPRTPQISIYHIQGHSLLSYTSPVQAGLLRTCRQIHTEASDFLYNSYLFNFVGTKKDTLKAYDTFLPTIHKYARHPVKVHAFSNGAHSATICISIHVEDRLMKVLKKRDRGEPCNIKELREEVADMERLSRRWWQPDMARWRSELSERDMRFVLACAMASVLCLIWALAISVV